MDLGMTPKVKPLVEKVRAMVRDEIMPLEHEYEAEVGKGDRWTYTKRQEEIREGLKAKARERGLWNFWLTGSDKGYGLTTVEYAYLAEEMGWSRLAPETFNCSAPDTGNMEVLERYGSPEHKEKWLKPLLEGKIRSAYIMTEPGVASSDATNIAHAMPSSTATSGCSTARNGSPPAPAIRAARSTSSWSAPIRRAEKHKRHSQILVPAGTKGVRDPARHEGLWRRRRPARPHAHPLQQCARAQGEPDPRPRARLRGVAGPARARAASITACAPSASRSGRWRLLCQRSLSREAFGKPLAQLGANYDIIAESRMKIEMARLLCLKAAYMMDTVGQRDAAPWISQIKVIAPRIALEITDEAVQMHGAMGITQDTPLAHMWTHLRTLRLADGPDAVHRRQVARAELKRYTNQKI